MKERWLSCSMEREAFDGATKKSPKNAQDTINDDEGYERGQIDTFSSRVFTGSRFLIADIQLLNSTFSFVLHCEDGRNCWL